MTGSGLLPQIPRARKSDHCQIVGNVQPEEKPVDRSLGKDQRVLIRT